MKWCHFCWLNSHEISPLPIFPKDIIAYELTIINYHSFQMILNHTNYCIQCWFLIISQWLMMPKVQIPMTSIQDSQELLSKTGPVASSRASRAAKRSWTPRGRSWKLPLEARKWGNHAVMDIYVSRYRYILYFII